MANGAYSARWSTPAALKCTKMVRTDYAVGHLVQKLHIQGSIQMPGGIAAKNHFTALNSVLVGPRHCTKPSMKIHGDRDRLKQDQVVGQKPIHAVDHFGAVHHRIRVKMSDVIERVHPRIRAAYAQNFDLGPQPCSQCGLQARLHRAAFGLPLPAKKVRAVVGQAQGIAMGERTLSRHEYQR